jgi:hypothetical protein
VNLRKCPEFCVNGRPLRQLDLETADAAAQIAMAEIQQACRFGDIASGLLKCLHKDGPLERIDS